MSKTTVKIFTNDYDVEMFEIKLADAKRPVFISGVKVLSILATNDNAEAIKPVKKHGRDMFSVLKPNGSWFTVGEKKINTVLDSEAQILLALHESIDSTKEA